MAESLAALLLLRLEGGEPALLLGRPDLPPLEAAAFARLLELGVVVQEAPLSTWDPCSGCDCGAEQRPIRWRDNVPFAPCPIDQGQDEMLDPEVLLVFRISLPAFATQLAAAVGLPDPPEEVLPAGWRLGSLPGGRPLVLAPSVGAVHTPGFLDSLRAVDREGLILLLGPSLPAVERARLARLGVLLVAPRDAFLPSERTRPLRLDLGRLPRCVAAEPRLVMTRGTGTACLDGGEVCLPPQPFALLWLLAEGVRDGTGTVPLRAIHAHLFGTVNVAKTAHTEVLRRLRGYLDQLPRRGQERPRDLIETRAAQGMRLALPAVRLID